MYFIASFFFSQKLLSVASASESRPGLRYCDAALHRPGGKAEIAILHAKFAAESARTRTTAVRAVKVRSAGWKMREWMCNSVYYRTRLTNWVSSVRCIKYLFIISRSLHLDIRTRSDRGVNQITNLHSKTFTIYVDQYFTNKGPDETILLDSTFICTKQHEPNLGVHTYVVMKQCSFVDPDQLLKGI